MRRAISRWEIVGFSVNDVIGSGVYLLPAAAAAILGWASVGAVVIAGFAVLLLVLCFAEAASYFDRPGSAYVYTREAFGELAGFEVGWMTWLARVASVSSLSVGFARAVGYLWPGANVGRGKALAIILPVLLLTWINVIGVKSGVRTAVFLAITKTLPLLVFIFVGVFYVSPALATSVTSKPGAGGLGDAVLLLLYAYAGFENTAAPAGEFKNPRRDVPFALITQIVIVTLIYTAVQWVALGTLPGVVNSQTPLADAAARFLPWGGLLMTVGGVISILGTNSNTVLSGPRYLYALAQEGSPFASLHPRFRTPAVAVVAQTAIALPLAFTGSFEKLATLSTVARLATYFGTALAVPFLRRKLGGSSEGTFRLPGGPVIPIIAVALCAVFAASANTDNLIAGAVALAMGAVIYGLMDRRPVTPDTEP
jgi:basic amino acid/polyamine antiporter, APA family